MWTFRVEILPLKAQDAEPARFIDIEFSLDYKLHRTHKQRIATEFRVPLYEGFTMPPSTRDSETAAMFKSLLLRPLSIQVDERPEDIRFADAFKPLCTVVNQKLDPNHAFTSAWLDYAKKQQVLATDAMRRFLDRHEFMSLWETGEMHDELERMWEESQNTNIETAEKGDNMRCEEPAATMPDPDLDKLRATVRQYSALIGQQVALNLEGLARARVEMHTRNYQSDAEIHQSYITASSGGGSAGDGIDPSEDGPTTIPQMAQEVFPIPLWNYDQDEMRAILNFEYRKRLTSLAKELLALPFMSSIGQMDMPSAIQAKRKAEGTLWRAKYRGLTDAPVDEKLRLKKKQEDIMELNTEEDNIEVAAAPPKRLSKKTKVNPLASFAMDGLYDKPSAFIRDLIDKLPKKENLSRGQTLFMVKFAQVCDDAWEDQDKPPEQHRVHHILLLGPGGSGKTHVIQKLVFEAVKYIWPEQSRDSPSMLVVASSNAQAKNISTDEVKARTLHNAAAMRVQHMVNPKMRPGNKLNALERLWKNVKVLVIEEVSMVSAANYNMLNFRAMYARRRAHGVNESNYAVPACSFGRCLIVIHLGDFLQLPPTAAVSLVTDVNARNPDGSYIFEKPPDLEIQHAIKIFKAIPNVFELRGTKRFVLGDPVIEFLRCMREGRAFPPAVWQAFEKTIATDHTTGELDPRHGQPKFLEGYGLAMYWETLSRWITKRACRDARHLGVPLVFLQAADECQTLDKDAYTRLLNVANLYNTGRIHGVFPCHTGMRVRFTGKFNGTYGLVQEQSATIVDFIFHEDDARRYRENGPVQMFRPKRLPTGIWLQVDDFKSSPLWESISMHVPEESLARGLFCMPLMEAEFSWRSSDNHSVKRYGFMLTHANYLTTTASQGRTIRAPVTIDCGRIHQEGAMGMGDDAWWLNLYVMLSRATKMEHMLLIRPPSRELLERGPPAAVSSALEIFEMREQQSMAEAKVCAERFGILLPPE